MSEQLGDRASAALAIAIAVLARSPHSLARSLAATPAQWVDAPAAPREGRASRHLVARGEGPRPISDDAAHTGVFRRVARGTPVVIAVTPAQPIRVMRPGRWRSLTAMSAGFEIERLMAP